MGIALIGLVFGFIGIWILTAKNFFLTHKLDTTMLLIIFILISMFSFASLLASIDNLLTYKVDSQMIKTKYEAYSEAINDPTLSLLFAEEIDNFNIKVKEAKKCDSFFMRWAFVSPAYALVDEIERSE